MATKTIAALAAALLALPAAAEWQVAKTTDATSYQTVTVLGQDAEDTIKDEYATKDVRPRLEFRCMPGGDGAVRARLDWRRFISSFNTPVEFAVDERDAVTIRMGVDRTNEITSTKAAADDDALLGYLDGGASLAVTVTPYSEVPVTVRFDLAGFAAKLDDLRKACRG